MCILLLHGPAQGAGRGEAPPRALRSVEKQRNVSAVRTAAVLFVLTRILPVTCCFVELQCHCRTKMPYNHKRRKFTRQEEMSLGPACKPATR